MKFGTDGVRGVANSELTAEFALRLGRAAARVLSAGDAPTVVIGGDTRISTPMLEAALAAGFAAEGVDVRRLGVVPTPAVAFAAQRTGAMGAMVSASHNPYRDNGIKLFATGGIKLADDVEAAIERELDAMQSPVGQPGRIAATGDDVIAEYVDHVVSIAGGRTGSSMRVVVDAANGAASSLARIVFERLGVDVVVIGDEPDGTNINDACGATFPSAVAEAVVARGADVGIALDGDARPADRRRPHRPGGRRRPHHRHRRDRSRGARVARQRHRRGHHDDQPRLPPRDEGGRHRRRHHRCR